MECKHCKAEFTTDSGFQSGHPSLYLSQSSGFCSVNCDRDYHDKINNPEIKKEK